jgi:hypothetical protein
MKILKDGVSQRPSQAIAYGLRVTEVLDKWPEKGQRQRRWLQPLDAAALVAEPDLGRLLRAVAVGRLLF